jgi:alpha-galactosidase
MSIKFEASKGVFSLISKNTLYQMKINELGVLQHLYYGRPVGDMDMSYQNRFLDRGFSGNPYERRLNRGFSLDLIPQEYSTAGVGDYRVGSIALVNEAGSRSVDFRYVSHRVQNGKYSIPGLPSVRENEDDVETLEIHLTDKHIGLSVKLLYSVYVEKDVITRSVEILNESDEIIKLEKAASVCIDFPYGKFDLLHFHGRHCMERQEERVALTHDIHTIGSKRGLSSHHHNPFVILCNPDTTEDMGDCYGFMMMYSGNHKTEVEVDQAGSTRLVMGIHDENFSWNLKAKESFYAPEIILSYSEKGLNKLSQNYHKIIRENVCHPRYLNAKRPILINNWEATYFDFNTDKIIHLANQAKELGIEMLVLDDGWFGKRNDDNSGLGDWFVNAEKLPGGIKRIADEVNKIGLQFGLWFEPEMINEDSDLYRTHPDWVLKDPDRKPMMSRNQLVLDMSRQDVVDYLYDSISKILDSANIAYIKWDFNRSVANVFSNLLSATAQGEVAHRFMLGTYALMERLTTNYPEVMIEGCAGGGGRFDAGILYYSPQIWCSDDTDPIARLKIQKGTSYGYPISTMGSHVSASPNHQTGRETTLKTRGIVAMSGTFGYELDLSKLSDEEKEQIKEQIQTFHKYYWLIQKGTYYRLSNVEDEKYFTSWQFVSQDQKEVLVNLVVTDVRANPEFPYVKLKGLKEEVWYKLEGTEQCFTGAALMYAGYVFSAMAGVYPCEQLHFLQVEK